MWIFPLKFIFFFKNWFPFRHHVEARHVQCSLPLDTFRFVLIPNRYNILVHHMTWNAYIVFAIASPVFLSSNVLHFVHLFWIFDYTNSFAAVVLYVLKIVPKISNNFHCQRKFLTHHLNLSQYIRLLSCYFIDNSCMSNVIACLPIHCIFLPFGDVVSNNKNENLCKGLY